MSPTDEEEAVLDARRWGATEAEIAMLREALGHIRGAVDFRGVWPQNLPVVEAFLAVASQWRTAIGATERGLRTFWLGLDYAGARVALDARDIGITPSLFAGMQVMEMAARDALNGVG